MSPKTLRNLLTAAVILVVGIVATTALIKISKKPGRMTPPPTRPLVTAITVSPDLAAVHVRGFGSVKAKRSITVVPQVSGEIEFKAPAFEPGTFVSAGELLLRIDDTDYALALATARSNVAQAEYNLALAQEEAVVAAREWERIGGQGQAGQAEASPLVMREPQLHLAEANLDAARAAVTQAEVNLGRCTITAPFDGRVLDADVDAGQYLRAGTAIGTVYATDTAEVTVTLPDADLAWISLGRGADAAGVPVAVAADFAGARHVWQGQAVRLGGAVDARSRLVPVVVEIPDPYHRVGDRPALVEGMFVEVTFSMLPQAGSVVVPRTALRPDDVVWVIGSDGLLDIRPVSVGRAGVDHAVITAGLQPGERVCTSNLQYVTQDMPVRVEGDPAPAGREPGAGGGGPAGEAAGKAPGKSAAKDGGK